MKKLPQVVLDAWDSREPIAVLSTVSHDGTPNVIYTRCVGRFDEGTFFIVNNAFHKTQRNILETGRVAFLFLTREGRSFQVKGRMEFHTEGPVFEEARKINKPEFITRMAAVLHVEEAYSGAEKLL